MKTAIPPNITEAFSEAARRYPDSVVFNCYDYTWKTQTYSEFSSLVISLATFLAGNGLRPGDRVAIVSENRPEWCCAYLAILMSGGTAVPIDAQLGPDEISNLLEDSGSRVVFHSGKTAHNVFISSSGLRREGKEASAIDFDTHEYAEALKTEPAGLFPARSPDDTASIIYTSGTTGSPKGVELTERNFCSDAEAVIAAGLVSHEDNVLSVLPLHHTYAFMCTFLVPVFLGASITYPASLKGPDIMSAVKDRGVSVLIGVPQLLGMIRNGIMDRIRGLPLPLPLILSGVLRLSGMLRSAFRINIGRVVFSSVHRALGAGFRFFASGGARLDPAIMKDLEALGFTVLEGYGLTETSPVVTFNPVSRRKPGSAGKPLPSVDIRILNPSRDGEGEIEIRGPMVMKGYYRNPSATSEVFDEGWFRTGDIGRIDKEGYLFITGRSKEVIVLSSGKNIYPEDVEKVYQSSPLIKEICILGAGERGGESLHAVIVPDLEYMKSSRISNIHEAIKWEVNGISGRLPSYMRVTGFSIRTEPFPRTPLGKLRRFLIKAGAVERPEAKKAEKAADDFLSDETAEAVVSALKRFAGESDKIGPDDNLELDIGLDSLSKIELVVSLEKTFSLKLPEDFLSGVQTVRELTVKVKSFAGKGYQAEGAEKTGWKEILAAGPSEGDLRMVTLESPENRMVTSFVAHSFLKFLFRCLFRLEAKGMGNIPSGRNFIIAPNHASYLDGFAVILSLPFSRFRNIYSLGMREFFTGFFLGRLAKVAHVIPIDSSSYLNKALQVSAYALKNGRSLVVFPEGGRSFDGSLLEFKKGVGILAVEMGMPVVPAYIEGAFDALPRGAAVPKCRKITVIFGEPLLAPEMDFSRKPEGVDDYQFFANELKERVGALKKRPG